MRDWVAACLVMLTACAGAFAQTKDVDIPYQKMVLDNGLTLIVHEDHKAPIVAINTWYHVGSKNEKLDPRRACTARIAGSAPTAPIASVPKSQRRSLESASVQTTAIASVSSPPRE